MSEFQTIQLEIDPRGVATLWLDRAGKPLADKTGVMSAAEMGQTTDKFLK